MTLHHPLLAALMLAGSSLLLAQEQNATPAPKSTPLPTIVSALDPSDLRDFDSYPPEARTLIEECLPLTKQNLGYKFGSSEPSQGGMDCSGTIYHVLRSVGIDDVPRTASDQYVWARKADNFEAVVSRKKDSFELDDLKPGDLLFWTGTYSTDRDPPVTHTMIYLGKLKSDGRQVMFGASDGRTYDGKKMYGVSVFDFTIPKPKDKGSGPGSVFIGYATIPGLNRAAAKTPVEEKLVPKEDDADESDNDATPSRKGTGEKSTPTPTPSRKSSSQGTSSEEKKSSSPNLSSKKSSTQKSKASSQETSSKKTSPNNTSSSKDESD